MPLVKYFAVRHSWHKSLRNNDKVNKIIINSLLTTDKNML